MKKKLIVLLLAAVMTIALLAGCEGKNGNDSGKTEYADQIGRASCRERV